MRIATVVLVLAALFAPTLALASDRSEPALIRIRPPGPPGDGWVWIPPTYRTVYEWVWQEPVYRTECDRYWVPDEYGWTVQDVWENGRWVKKWDYVLVRPGHWATRTYQVLVSPGRWAYEPRQVLVRAGHWEWRPSPPPWPDPPMPPRPPMPIPAPPSVRSPDLAPFSPLWEWPDKK